MSSLVLVVSKRVLFFDILRFEILIYDIFDLERLSWVKFGLERVIKKIGQEN